MNRVCPSSPHATLEVGCPVSIVPRSVPSEAITLSPPGRAPMMLPCRSTLNPSDQKKRSYPYRVASNIDTIVLFLPC
jgi:hypothetical protein